MRFAERVALVTGGGSGIGREIARRFAAEGASVFVVDRIRERADGATTEIESAGGAAMGWEADVSDGKQVDSMIDAVQAAFGTVDILVNNAFAARAQTVHSMREQDWDGDVATTLKGVFLCSRRVLPAMMERRSGIIVNIASVNAFLALGDEAYSAAKAGMVNLTKNLAVRYGPYGIRVNAVAPATVRTPNWDPVLARDPRFLERIARWYPLGRVGEPRDVAAAVLFLASEEASWITGVTLPVDGGLGAGNRLMMQEILGESGEDLATNTDA